MGQRGVIAWVVAGAVLVGLSGAPGSSAPVAGQVPPGPPGPGLLPVPAPLPPGPPGEVLASVPFASGPFPFTVEPHQVLYRSTDRHGGSIPVSGYVLVPTGVPAPPGGRHVVAWAHGTSGIVDGCAPSLDAQSGGGLNSPDSYQQVVSLLAAGHIVTASDYPGLGTPGLHPYMDGFGEGRAVLDSIRAARAFGGTSTAVVVGFSQGGQAAIFAGEEQPGYAPDIDLRGVVSIGTPSLMGAAIAAGSPYASLGLAGLVTALPELDRTEILTPSGEAEYDALIPLDRPDGPCVWPEFDFDRDMMVDPMDLPAWRASIESVYPGQRIVPAPVLLIQSESDEDVPAPLAYHACNTLVAHGSDVRMWIYDDEDHVASVVVSSHDRSRWVLDRLAGLAVDDTVAFAGEVPRVVIPCPAGEASEGGGSGAGAEEPAARPATPVRSVARFAG
ncbi:MAG TPA: lipase family protein [Acidimicrobiales bacterium]|nr:lipase family protein [Acidimicrobiales bacterium]